MSELRTRHAWRAKRQSTAVNEPGVRTIGGVATAAHVAVVEDVAGDAVEVVTPISRPLRVPRRSLAERMAGAQAVDRLMERRFDDPSVHQLMRQREASPLKRSFA